MNWEQEDLIKEELRQKPLSWLRECWAEIMAFHDAIDREDAKRKAEAEAEAEAEEGDFIHWTDVEFEMSLGGSKPDDWFDRELYYEQLKFMQGENDVEELVDAIYSSAVCDKRDGEGGLSMCPFGCHWI